jgi:hypothetical protein
MGRRRRRERLGFGLYVQAFQLVATGLRASAAVGCVVR